MQEAVDMRFERLIIALKALHQLGLQPVALNALYRLGLATGHYRRVGSRQLTVGSWRLKCVLPLPSRDEILAVLGDEGQTELLAEADEIVAGKVRLFSSEPADLKLTCNGPLAHWTDYETNPALLSTLYSRLSTTPDIKFIWEPARFGWAFTLGRAYHVSGDEKYSEIFWHYAETFLNANPPYLGPHWMSGQEVALRLMAFVWAAGAFTGSKHATPERLAHLARSVAAHAERLPPTLVYARSQNNNHLLVEAAGLYTAGLALPEHPSAAKWCALGWKWLNQGFHSQIDGYGEYAQHSTNYHRLMLQVALWVDAIIRSDDFSRYPRQTTEALGRATHWLLALLDSAAGRTPNLGANDGAYIFPLTVCPFEDYRPVLHAAARAFLNYDLPRGPWDEMSFWFGTPLENPKYLQLPRYLGDQVYGKESWAYLRTAQFNSRPSHADQLHLDLWWRGLNVTQDAGTYLYNAASPWDNSLVTAFVHNTVTVEDRDQFTRAGRFLYLDWFNAYRKNTIAADERILQQVFGQQRGYGRQGVRHTRTVIAYADGHWQILDELIILRLPHLKKPLRFRLHWLLPDWEWKVENGESEMTIRLKSPHGWMMLRVLANEPFSKMTLARAGERIFGEGEVSPVTGWVSPTYGIKVPALSLTLEASAAHGVEFTSEFIFPKP
jgi:hypothetical protein